MALPAPAPDCTAVVTGASSGIGSELARVLAARGFGVTLVARREDRLRALADELGANHGVKTEVIAADLTDPASRERLLAEVGERGLTSDVLINNAGFSTTGAVHASDPAKEIAMIRTDVEAVAHLCSLFLPGMVSRGRGAVLNVASTAAFQPLPGQAAYGASKAFVVSYSRALRGELHRTGVTCTALCPGPVETEFAETAGFTEEESSNALPKFMWEPASEVAEVGIRGLDKDKAVVIPGFSNRAAARFAYFTPKSMLVSMLAKQHPALKA